MHCALLKNIIQYKAFVGLDPDPSVIKHKDPNTDLKTFGSYTHGFGCFGGPALDNDLFSHMNLDLDLDLNPDFSRIQREVPHKLFSWF